MRRFILVVLILGVAAGARVGQTQSSGVPVFDVDPSWPKALPNNFTFGEFSGVTVDSHDHIWILDRATRRVLGNFGRQGRDAGQFHHSHSIAVDSKGNIYVAETQGTRVQRFLFKGVE